MKHLHLEKKGLRGLAIAESFRQNSKDSILVGIVMRLDFTIDGFVFGNTTLGGDDATDVILQMYEKLQRPDINYVIISGLIISMYNIIDIKKLYEKLQIPVIAVTYNPSKGIEDVIKHHFPNQYQTKISKYKKLGTPQIVELSNSRVVFVRFEGCDIHEAKLLLNDLTIQGSVPEPIRVAQLLANVLLQDKIR